MSILSNYFSPNVKDKDDLLKRNNYINQNKIILKNGLKLHVNKNMLKLPKININEGLMAYQNQSNERFNTNAKEDELEHFYKISKITSYRQKNFSMKNKQSENKNNLVKKNKFLNGLNQTTKGYIKNRYNLSNSVEANPIAINENLNSDEKEQTINKNTISTNVNNDKNETIKDLIYFHNTYGNLNKSTKDKIVNDYVNELLSEGKEKEKKEGLPNLDIQEITDERFKLEKSIDPTKYIKNKFLDESNNNTFKTSKIQIDCFNGNEKLRDENIKKINANNMNSINIDSIKLENKDYKTQSLINQMIPKKLKNFYFGKKKFSSNFTNIKINSSINNKKHIEPRENDYNYDLTLDEKLENAMIDTKIMEKKFLESHKSRGVIMRKLKELCDNYNGMIQKASEIKKRSKSKV